MKWTTWLLDSIAVLLIVVFILYEKNIHIHMGLIYKMAMFVGIGLLLLYLFQKTDLTRRNTKMFDALKRAMKIWKEKGDGDTLTIGELGRGSVATFDENGKTYYAWILSGIRHDKVALVWDVERDDIADYDLNPPPSRLSDPFFEFNPVLGRYNPVSAPILKTKRKKKTKTVKGGSSVNGADFEDSGINEEEQE